MTQNSDNLNVEYLSRMDPREIYHEDETEAEGITVAYVNYTNTNLRTYMVNTRYYGYTFSEQGFEIAETSPERACEVAERQACIQMFGNLDMLGYFFAYCVREIPA